jgi:hypothetical protein
MTLRRRDQVSEDSEVSDLLCSDDDSENEVETSKPDHPVKGFFLPNSWISQFLSVPSQIVFAIAGLFGMANYARQIVKIRPKQDAVLKLRNGNGATKEGRLSRWIEESVPSLSGSFKPSWWLPK